MKAAGRLRGQVEQPHHQRRHGALEHAEHVEPVEPVEDERAEDEERQRLAQVPLDPRRGLDRDVRGLRAAGAAAAPG